VGLTAKGRARREALLDAVLRVLARDGSGAVTHRAVAAEAGVPVSAATYYFATIDELYLSALRRATQQQVALFADIHNDDLAAFARVLHSWVYDNRAAAIAQYELMFLAMRRDSLRDDAELWYRALEQAIDPGGSDPARARVTALAVDGLLLRMLWLGDPATPGETEHALRQIVDR